MTSDMESTDLMEWAASASENGAIIVPLNSLRAIFPYGILSSQRVGRKWGPLESLVRCERRRDGRPSSSICLFVSNIDHGHISMYRRMDPDYQKRGPTARQTARLAWSI